MTVKIKQDTRQFVNVAWIRNGDFEVRGEALILACLLHTKGDRSQDLEEVQKIMLDHNLEKPHKARK